MSCDCDAPCFACHPGERVTSCGQASAIMSFGRQLLVFNTALGTNGIFVLSWMTIFLRDQNLLSCRAEQEHSSHVHAVLTSFDSTEAECTRPSSFRHEALKQL